MNTITDLFLFEGLSSDTKEAIAAGFPEAHCFSKGEIIYSKDKFFHAMGIILEGRALAIEDRLLKRSFKAGDCFGAAAMFGSADHYIGVISAATDCRVVFLTEEFLTELFTKHPVTSINYIAFLSDRVRFLNKKLNLYTCKDAGSRLYRYFLDNEDSNHTVTIKNMSQLAKLTSLGRTSLYRALEELVNEHMIERIGDTIKSLGD